MLKHLGKVLSQERRAVAEVLRSVEVHLGRVLKAAKEQVRWMRKQDWELINVESTDETSLFPTVFHPLFVLTWRCKLTGDIRD